MNKAKFECRMSGEVEAMKQLGERLMIASRWDFECYDKDGNLKWQELDRPNVVTTEGLNYLLEVMFRHGLQIQDNDWFITAIETDTTAAITQTYAVPVYTEWDGYTEAARQLYVPAAASGGAVTNTASKAIFTASEDKTLYGGALVGGGSAASTWKDTAGGGILFCYSKFSSSKAVESGDTFKITCAIQAADV
jgi:hypothetical protein